MACRQLDCCRRLRSQQVTALPKSQARERTSLFHPDYQRRVLRYAVHELPIASVKRDFLAASREIDGNDVLQREQGVIDGCERDLGATKADIGAHHIAVAVEPLGLAVAFAVEKSSSFEPPAGSR